MLRTIVRFVVSAVVLLVVAWLLPGISVSGFWGALVAAAVIALIGWAVEKIMGKEISPRSHGIVGFVTAAVVIYLAQFLIPNYLNVSILGSLLAAFVIGLVDTVVPTELR
jgi:putative membrane protein